MNASPYEEILAALRPIVPPTDLLAESETQTIVREISAELAGLSDITVDSLEAWVDGRADAIRVLGLSVGLGQERLKIWAKHNLGTQGFGLLAKNHARATIELLDSEHNLIRAIDEGRHQQYSYSDILVTRATSKSTANRAASAGRSLEDLLEEAAVEAGLEYSTRGRFTGIGGRTAPYDLAILDQNGDPVIVVGAKAFDSTGSKLSDALREVEEMAQTRLPRQYVFAAIDGIGWKGRESDLKKIHQLWVDQRIDGIYSASTMDDFKARLIDAGKRLGLL